MCRYWWNLYIWIRQCCGKGSLHQLVACWIERTNLCDGKIFRLEDHSHASANDGKEKELQLETTSNLQWFPTSGSEYRLYQITQTVLFQVSLPRRIAVTSLVSLEMLRSRCASSGTMRGVKSARARMKKKYRNWVSIRSCSVRWLSSSSCETKWERIESSDASINTSDHSARQTRFLIKDGSAT